MDKQDKTAERESIIDFLIGAGKYDGIWFGEDHPHRTGKFWWRIPLMEHVAELEVTIKTLQDNLPFEIRVANKEISQDLSDCEKQLRAEIHANGALHKRIQALKERLEAADEVIESVLQYGQPYSKAIEKYNSLKQ